MYVELVLSLLFRAMPALAWARVKNFAVELAGLCSGVFSFFEKLHRKIVRDIRTENIVGHA